MKLAALVAVLLALVAQAAAQTPVEPPPLPAEQERRLAELPPDTQVYERFRYWAGLQPPDVQDKWETYYERYLQQIGVAQNERARRIQVIHTEGQRLEVERWNRILTADKPLFNTHPNAFLVEVIKDRPPGTALDVGMGQGRNAIYLAQQGWTVTGFDPADQAVAQANATAAKLGVKINTVVKREEDFDFGDNQWDLIVLSYVGAREFVDRVVRSLKPGGLVVVEGFHRDVTRTSSVGGAVVFDTNELPKLFSALRVLRYEDVEAKNDFGRDLNRAVRLLAQKERSAR
jgi:2-polyprenyl-3-methyl-5-hydroxy-6-metoxy-1,4-benzoquinol methylase